MKSVKKRKIKNLL